jgi:4-diphosphocytidyl-2-C-methyl-D-erythritol kinase
VQSLTIEASAKINLSLDVVGKRPDGYHLLATVMQSVAWSDRVYLELDRQGNGLMLLSDTPGIPLDARNTAYRAARLFADAAGLDAGVRIYLEKRIPEAAGLAGGSSDAAAVLYGLSELCSHPLSRERLFELAAQVGADVPFCLAGGTVLCEGIGEILTPLPSLPATPLLLVKPDFGLKTPWVFSQLDLENLGPRPDHPRLLAALASGDLAAARERTANVLETVSTQAHPELGQLKARLTALGSPLAMMSGSGPTVFGLFADSDTRDEAVAVLTRELPPSWQLIRSETCAQGQRIVG